MIVPVEYVWQAHAMGTGHAPGDDRIGAPWQADLLPGLPAIVVKPESIAAAYGLRSRYRTSDSMAFFPAETLVELYEVTGGTARIMAGLTLAAQILVVAAILAGLLAVLDLQRQRFAVLRALGAPASYLFLTVWLYVTVMVLGGALLGLPLGWAASALISARISVFTGVAMQAQLGVAERRYVTNISKAQELGTGLEQVTDAHVRMSLQLQAAFGLRREEAIKFQPSYADRGDHIALKGSWTKGGRERTVPITTTEQRDALQAAHCLAGAGSLIPANKTYIQQRHVYDGQCKAAGLSHMHGLRHQYAQSCYEALTGWPAPAAGGPPVRTLSDTQRTQDTSARQIISRELGHERSQVTSIYLGK